MRTFSRKPAAPAAEQAQSARTWRTAAATLPATRDAAVHGHDFSRIPTHGGADNGAHFGNHGGSSPATSQTATQTATHTAPARAAGSVSVHTELRPHAAAPANAREQAAIYAQGKTPLQVGCKLVAWGAAPLGAAATGAHLADIGRRFGDAAVARSVQGPGATRGARFAEDAAQRAGFSARAGTPEGGPIGRQAAAAIRASATPERMPAALQERLGEASGQRFDDVAIHNDAGAHRAAALLNARAFTLGHAIYFGRGAYEPHSAAGQHLLAHEAAHTVQQGAGPVQVDEHVSSGAAGGDGERHAEQFADALGGARAPAAPLRAAPGGKLIQRAISFTHDNDTFATNNVGADENATGFQLTSAPDRTFQWDTDVTIHGVAGDPFANFQVGFLQLERVFYVNVHWGTGANHTHRNVHPDAALPRRDAQDVGSIFASDDAPYVRPAFGANGDVRSPTFHDTPRTARMPWTNPVAGRAVNSGWFNYGDAFVTYLSARDTVAGTFRDLANVYWNLSAEGTFDGARPLGARVALTAPGPVNHSAVIEGGSAEFPAMHGGTIANGHDVTTDT